MEGATCNGSSTGRRLLQNLHNHARRQATAAFLPAPAPEPQSHTEWRADLDAGYRFLPDLTSKPYGTIREADRTGVNVWVSHHDLRNFNLCLEYHESGAEILDVFPGKIDSTANSASHRARD